MGDDNGRATERNIGATKNERQAATRLAGVLLSSLVEPTCTVSFAES
jgi:hypothetical protein